jgi:mono/diheme cytochrome c family protein
MAMLASIGGKVDPATASDSLRRGEYLVTIMDCTGCHTDGALIGAPDPTKPLAGSRIGFRVPGLGTVYPPNLTPDPETGLGRWSEAEIVTAVRTGERPDGRVLAVMPWRSYAILSDKDALAVAAYLKSLPPIRHAAPPLAGESERPQGPYLDLVQP